MDQFHFSPFSLPFVTASTGLLELRDNVNWKIPVRSLSVEFSKRVGTVFVFMKVLLLLFISMCMVLNFVCFFV